jgi:hypothetical protein
MPSAVAVIAGNSILLGGPMTNQAHRFIVCFSQHLVMAHEIANEQFPGFIRCLETGNLLFQ